METRKNRHFAALFTSLYSATSQAEFWRSKDLQSRIARTMQGAGADVHSALSQVFSLRCLPAPPLPVPSSYGCSLPSGQCLHLPDFPNSLCTVTHSYFLFHRVSVDGDERWLPAEAEYFPLT